MPEVQHLDNKGDIINAFVPQGFGFALLTFPLEEGGGLASYTHNGHRKTVEKALNEFLEIITPKKITPVDLPNHTGAEIK